MEGKTIVDLTANMTQAKIVFLPGHVQSLGGGGVSRKVFVDVQQHAYTALDILLHVEPEDPVLIGHAKVEAVNPMDLSLLPGTNGRIALKEHHSSVVRV